MQRVLAGNVRRSFQPGDEWRSNTHCAVLNSPEFIPPKANRLVSARYASFLWPTMLPVGEVEETNQKDLMTRVQRTGDARW